MNLRQLEVFVAVAEEQNFSRAADRLSVVQSAVSAGVRALEAELGASLFERTARGALLTDAGAALLPEARATLAAAQAARDAVAEAGEGLRGTVVLGIMQAMRDPAPNPARLIAGFRRSHPGVEVLVRHGGGSALMAQQISDGELDLGFVSVAPATARVELRPLSRQPIELAVSHDHQLAGRAAVDLRELGSEVFAELPPLWGTRIVNDRAFAAAGAQRQIRYEVNDTSTLVEFVRFGLAVSLLPRSIIGAAPGVVSVPIRAHAPHFEISIATPTGRRMSAAARALHEHIAASGEPADEQRSDPSDSRRSA